MVPAHRPVALRPAEVRLQVTLDRDYCRAGSRRPLAMVFKVLPVSLVIGASCALYGCGGEEVKYQPKPAFTGTKANLPSVPALAKKPIKQGEDYTVWGA